MSNGLGLNNGLKSEQWAQIFGVTSIMWASRPKTSRVNYAFENVKNELLAPVDVEVMSCALEDVLMTNNN